MMYGAFEGWGWHGGLGMIHGVVWLVLVVLGIVVLVRLLGRSQANPPTQSGAAPETALEVLKKRYARGEIDKAEFEEKKRDLS